MSCGCDTSSVSFLAKLGLAIAIEKTRLLEWSDNTMVKNSENHNYLMPRHK